MRVYILAKNEKNNIEKCLRVLINHNLEPIVLDSGSTDGTVELAKAMGAEVKKYNYINHCVAYNELTLKEPHSQYIMILDADMVIGTDLYSEIIMLTENGGYEVIIAPVKMIYSGYELRFSSLCPPKPIVFKSGKEYFQPIGHGERLRKEIETIITENLVVHDDRKGFEAYLQTQVRYTKEFMERATTNSLSLKDKLRFRTPLMIFAVPFYSLIIKLGILDGRGGLIYAADRMIAEIVKYRTSLTR